MHEDWGGLGKSGKSKEIARIIKNTECSLDEIVFATGWEMNPVLMVSHPPSQCHNVTSTTSPWNVRSTKKAIASLSESIRRTFRCKWHGITSGLQNFGQKGWCGDMFPWIPIREVLTLSATHLTTKLIFFRNLFSANFVERCGLFCKKKKKINSGNQT